VAVRIQAGLLELAELGLFSFPSLTVRKAMRAAE